MIRDVVIHMQSEQPLLADVERMPAAEDVSLICTNLRYMNGNKPAWIDSLDSWFVFPLNTMRFVEVSQASLGRAEGLTPLKTPMIRDNLASEIEDVEPDEDLLRRIREA